MPPSRVPSHPRQRGRVESDVVIVGGGLTGCATAYAFSAAGIKVLLLEGEQIGHGATGASAGWIGGDDPGAGFAEVEKALGSRSARRAWQAWHRAGLDFSALVRRLHIKCALEPHGSLDVAMNPEQGARIKKEIKARRDGGIDTPVLSARVIAGETGLSALSGVRIRDGATIDPYRAALGLAAAAAGRGASVFERSPVTRITFNRKTADVYTAAGSIRTTRVVIATGGPTALFKALRRHFWFRRRYLVETAAIPARVRQRLGSRASVVRDAASPPHVVRWVGDDRLIVAGADAEAPPDRLRDKVIIQRTGQLMYELSTLYPDISGIAPSYGWDAPYARTGDGLPYIGPHRNYPHHLFVFGDSSHGIAGSYLASRILLRHHLGQLEPADAVFGFRL